MNPKRYEMGHAECIRETDKALLVNSEYGELWIPKSQIHDDSEVYEDGDDGELVVNLWFAEKEGWV